MQTSVALSADYAEALLTARRAKNWTFGILAMLILAQLALFFIARYSSVLAPASAATLPTESPKGFNLIHYAIALSGLVAMGTVLVMCVTLLLIVAIMLIGRLIGVARLTSAFLAAVVLLVILFPWQGFLRDGALAGEGFRLVGTLYTWEELLRDARFGRDGAMDVAPMILKWFRFVGLPVVALLVLWIAQRRSARGLRMALGESDAEPTDSTLAV